MTSPTQIKITLSFRTQTASILVNPYDKLYTLYDKLKTLFYPAPQSVTFLYNNHPITSFNNKDIDEVFRNRKQVSLVVAEFYQESSINRKNSQSPQKQTMLQKNQSPEVNKAKAPKDTISTFLHEQCSECHLNSVLYYCRDCNIFLCKDCRLLSTSPHFKHRLIQVFYDNINKSALLYKQLIQSDLGAIQKDVNKSTKELKTHQNADLFIWKQGVMEKLGVIYKLLKEKKEQLTELEPDFPIDDQEIEDRFIETQIEIQEKPTPDMTDPLRQMNDFNEKDKKQMRFTKNLENMIRNEMNNRFIDAICHRIGAVLDLSYLNEVKNKDNIEDLLKE